jgi:Superinfection immunity protein
MGYPNGHHYTDKATGIDYTWDGQQWLQDGGQSPAYRAGQQPPAAPQPASYSAPPPYQQQYPQPYPQNVGPAYVTDQRSKNIQAIIAWILAVLTFGYMLPWAIAATRGKSNAGMIGILNLLLGWTLVGWIVALVMACNAHQIAAAAPNISVTAVGIQNTYPGAPSYPQSGWTPNGQAAPPPIAHPSAAQPARSDPPFNAELPQPGRTAELPHPAHEA